MIQTRLCGLNVESELPLPDLAVSSGEGQVDLTVRLGSVPHLDTPAPQGKLLQVAEDGRCRFEIPNVAAYGVDPGGREVVIEPHMDAASPDIRVFLFGTVLAIVCFKRGLLPLHASCIRIGDKAVAFSGISGAGKSTQAAVFHKRGIPVLSDDVTVIDARGAAPVVHSSLPRLKLWRDMMEECAFSTDGLEHTRAQLEKYYLPLDHFPTAQVPLSVIYFLENANLPQKEGFFPVSGVERFLALDRGIYRRAIGYRLLGAARIFADAGKIAPAVRMVKLCRIKSLARAEDIVDEILRREGAA